MKGGVRLLHQIAIDCNEGCCEKTLHHITIDCNKGWFETLHQIAIDCNEGWCETLHHTTTDCNEGWCATLHQITIDCNEGWPETLHRISIDCKTCHQIAIDCNEVWCETLHHITIDCKKRGGVRLYRAVWGRCEACHQIPTKRNNGCVDVAWAWYWGQAGARNLVFFWVKWLRPAMEGTSCVRRVRAGSFWCFFVPALLLWLQAALLAFVCAQL